jgi:hypothetical protein
MTIFEFIEKLDVETLRLLLIAIIKEHDIVKDNIINIMMEYNNVEHKV